VVAFDWIHRSPSPECAIELANRIDADGLRIMFRLNHDLTAPDWVCVENHDINTTITASAGDMDFG
jgi:hypothetical protein